MLCAVGKASDFLGGCKTGFHFNERSSYSQYTVREGARRNSKSGPNGRLCGMVDKHQNCENWHPRCISCLLSDPRLSHQDSLSLCFLFHTMRVMVVSFYRVPGRVDEMLY